MYKSKIICTGNIFNQNITSYIIPKQKNLIIMYSTNIIIFNIYIYFNKLLF